MADKPKIDIGEVFGVVGGAASGISDALAPESSAAPLAASPLGTLDIGGMALGGAVGGGIAYAMKGNVGLGVLAGALVGALVPIPGVTGVA